MHVRSTLDLWRSTFELYRNDDAESAALRAHHLGQVVRLVPALLLANAVNAFILMWVFGSAAGGAGALWLAVVAVLGALMARGWWRWRLQSPQAVSRRVLRRAALQAGALGAVWGAAPLLWFHDADGSARMLLATVVTGMMGGGAFVLVPLPASALAYVAVLTLAGLLTLLRETDTTLFVTMALLLSYGFTLALGATAGARRATALLRAQRDAARQRGIVQVLLQDFESHAAEALWEIDREGRLSHLSPRLCELLGRELGSLRAAPLLEVLQALAPVGMDALALALRAGRPFEQLRLEVATPEPRWWDVAGKPLFDDGGRALGWRGVIADVTAEVEAQRRLLHLAHHDALTGLANRLSLTERLAERLRTSSRGALLLIDLDHFKAVNDSLGHSVGDALLKVVAVRLSACGQAGDTVARLGGDEFAMVVASLEGADDALALGARVVEALGAPLSTAGRTLRAGASVGVALWPEHGRSVDALMGHADIALYDAKNQGRGRAALYTPRLGEQQRRRVDIEHGLRQALEGGGLALHWQAQVDLGSWAITGAEGLLRWCHPDLGVIGPAEFVSVAEQCGLIQPLGDWVLEEACRAARLQLSGLTVSINVSPAQLRDDGFCDRVRQALQVYRIDPAQLELEITESLFIDDVDGAFERLQALRSLGVRIALDDFGTGYSSLAYLRRFPFDTLKIDRTFVSELLLRADSRAIVRTIIQLAATMGMRTVAEGVESRAQLEVVQASGCGLTQGYLVAPPCTAEAFAELRRNWNDAPPRLARLH